MSSNPYQKSPPPAVQTTDDDNISMKDSSPSSKNSADTTVRQDGTQQHEDMSPRSKTSEADVDNRFDENHFQIPPSFGRPITEETLRDADHPYIFWASLRLPIAKDPANPMAAVYDALEEFVSQFADEDPNFVVFPYNLSDYKSVEDLPPPIKTAEDIPDDIEEWLEYFPGAKPRVTGGDTYTALLIGLSVPLPKIVKNLSAWMRNKCFGLWKAYLQSEKPTSLGWLLFSTQTMDINLLKDAISDHLENIPIGLRWKMISQGSQGAIPKDQQVKALHVLVDELDVPMAKPLLLALYTSKPGANHKFPLHIRMQIVPEIDMVLNTKGRQSVDKLRACQKTWLAGKLIQIKTWEIELLDDESEELGMTLRDAMMDLRHPTNSKFNLFHSIDKHFCDSCHVLTVLKSAESHAHAMIVAMLPYLLWQHAQSKPGPKASALKKWFSPEAHRRAEDAFWCPKDECVKNPSDLMLAEALEAEDALYWEVEVDKAPSPKRKRPQAEEESLNDSVPTVNTAMSAKKLPKTAIKGNQSNGRTSTQTRFATDSQTVASQVTTISQLTDMVTAVQQDHKTLLSRFDKLTEQLSLLLSDKQSSPSQRPAGGHASESGRRT